MQTPGRRSDSGLAMILVLATWVVCNLVILGFMNLVVGEILSAQNESNEVRAQNWAEAGLALGWAAVENWSTWCTVSGSVAGEANCPVGVQINGPQGGYTQGQIDSISSNTAVRVLVGEGNTAFYGGVITNPNESATSEALIRQTALVLPTALSFAIFSNTEATVTAPPTAGTLLPVAAATLTMPQACVTNSGAPGSSDQSTDICSTMQPVSLAYGVGVAYPNAGSPILGTIYANGFEVANQAPLSSVVASWTTQNTCSPAGTICLIPYNNGTAANGSVSITGTPPGSLNGSTNSAFAAAYCNGADGGSGCSANVMTAGGASYQFLEMATGPAATAHTLAAYATSKGTFYSSAYDFYTLAACPNMNAQGVTTLPSGVYFIADRYLVFDSAPHRCLGNVQFASGGGSIVVYCDGAVGTPLTTVPCASDASGGAGQPNEPQYAGGLPAADVSGCILQTPCGDIIFGSQFCTSAAPCTFLLKGNATASSGFQGTPVLVAGGSIVGCGPTSVGGAASGVCTNTIAGNPIQIPDHSCGAGCFTSDPAYLVVPWGNAGNASCGTATWGLSSNPDQFAGSLYVYGLVFAAGNNLHMSGGGDTSTTFQSSYGLCVNADWTATSGTCLAASYPNGCGDAVGIQGAVVVEQVYQFSGQVLWDPSVEFGGLSPFWAKVSALSLVLQQGTVSGQPLESGSVTIIPLSETTGQ